MSDGTEFTIKKIESPNMYDRYEVSGKSPTGHQISETILGLTLRNATIYETFVKDNNGAVPRKIIRLFDILDICHDFIVPYTAKYLTLDHDGVWYFI